MKKNAWKKYSWLIILLAVILVAELVLLIFKPWGKKTGGGQDSAIALTGDPVLDYLRQEGADCGYENAFSELSLLSSTQSGDLTFHRYQQYYHGLKVENQSVVCVTDVDGTILSVTGNIDDVDPTLSLNPTTTKEVVTANIKSYLEEELNDTVSSVDFGELSQDKLCIYGLRNQQDVLSYNLEVFFSYLDVKCGCRIVIDANNGSVLYMETASEAGVDGYTDTSATVTTSTGESYNNITIGTNDAGESVLLDQRRKIQMWDFEYTTPKFFTTEHILEKYYKFTQADPPKKTVVDTYVNLQASWDCFTELIGENHNGGTYTVAFAGVRFFNDGDGLNDLYGNADAIGIVGGEGRIRVGVALGNGEPLSSYIDMIAHEYAHTVEKRRVGIEISGEAGAFVEAFADVFGEVVEAHKLGVDTADWVNKKRNIMNPNETGCYQHIDDIEINFSKKEYKMSTVLSHTAYLLQCNGVSLENIAKLWFNTMLMMPEDGTLYEVRELMELAGRQLHLDVAAIGAAFDTVGIVTDNSVYEVEIGLGKKIQVNDFAGALYDNYDYRLWHLDKYEKKKPVSLYPTEKKALKKDSVRNQNAVDLQLEKGVYLLELKDCDPTKDEERFYYLCVTDNGGDIRIDTFDGSDGFGSVTFTGTVYGGEDGKEPIANAAVNIATSSSYFDKRTGKTVAGGTFTCTTDSSGRFSVSGLPVGDYKIFASHDGNTSEYLEIKREDLTRYHIIQLLIDDVNLQKLIPHLQLYFSCECQKYGMTVGAEKYYAIAATSQDSLNLNFGKIVPVSEYTLTGDDRISQRIAVLSEVTNFTTEEACRNNLYDHMTDNLVNNWLVRGDRKMYTYNGKLYYVTQLGYGMGDPPEMVLETAQFKRVSKDTCTVDVPRYMAGTVSGVERFTFTKDGDKWKISKVQKLD